MVNFFAQVLSYFKDAGAVPQNKKEKVKKEAQPLLVLEEEKSPEQILAEEVSLNAHIHTQAYHQCLNRCGDMIIIHTHTLTIRRSQCSN